MPADLKLTEFLARTASSDPVPGGGSVSALGGAIAAALSEMVANLTIGKKGYETSGNDMLEVVKESRNLREKLVADIDRDSEAYGHVMAAFRLPNDTEEQKRKRGQAVQDGLKKAALVPLGIARDAGHILDLAGKVVAEGNKNAVTDGAVAAMMARTAVLGALLNVKINLASIKDVSFVEDISRQIREIESGVDYKEKEILSKVGLSRQN
ncbi:MAG TPA: methenyltetrahydrofolate cyclohydrolase [Desulfobacteraceae bacterium]|nr:methenyltetrahydrofolate cyclohydrolase [Desulfobacteraceae bacterium]